MTSVRAWACPKMFSRVVGFRRSAGLCHEIIYVYPWGGRKVRACFQTELVPVEWRNRVLGRLEREVCELVFLEWCRILGRGGTGPASKSDWQVQKNGSEEKKAYGARFNWSCGGVTRKPDIKVVRMLNVTRLPSVSFTLSALSPNIRFLCGKHTSASSLAWMLTELPRGQWRSCPLSCGCYS